MPTTCFKTELWRRSETLFRRRSATTSARAIRLRNGEMDALSWCRRIKSRIELQICQPAWLGEAASVLQLVSSQRLPEIDRTTPGDAITLVFPAAFLLSR